MTLKIEAGILLLFILLCMAYHCLLYQPLSIRLQQQQKIQEQLTTQIAQRMQDMTQPMPTHLTFATLLQAMRPFSVLHVEPGKPFVEGGLHITPMHITLRGRYADLLTFLKHNTTPIDRLTLKSNRRALIIDLVAWTYTCTSAKMKS